ncbi:unnamed protein product [Didymodactylos carnosus]|uniref:Uncharacterized protein n=1 Tax=Didymodactylos carnosus TaxID=1234261 RepID=A0A814BFP1_9BILA|nr:unnamed protein product [Didymodactylos carnosus]CAF3707244.1 unnamed protein product [Didymodactylos carnosus]
MFLKKIESLSLPTFDGKQNKNTNGSIFHNVELIVEYIQQKLTVERPHTEAIIQAAGFTYIENSGGRVQCSQCKLEIPNLTKEMVPFDEHKRQSPSCPYVKDITGVSEQYKTPSDQSISPTGVKPQKLQKTETSTCVVDATTQKNINKQKQDAITSSSSAVFRNFTEVETIRQVRKRTFSHWPHRAPSRNQMVEAGFFNCNVGDRVICIYCNVICQQWTPHNDDPVEIHKILSPNCSYVKLVLRKTASLNSIRIVNETGRQSSQTVPTNDTSHPTNNNNSSDVLRCNEIVLTAACNIAYSEIPKRYASFATWPNEPLPSVDDLVKSGFYYTGTKTIVTCFYCNGSLQNWGQNDNPMIEHARWFPQCAYARQLCGDDLYRKIQDSKRAAQERTRASEQLLSSSKGFSIINSNENSSTTLSTSNSRQLVIPDDSTLSRLVAARLDLPISQHLLSKDFKLSIIKRCYEDQLRLKHDDFAMDCDLLLACTILQKQIEHIDGKKENIIIPSVHMKKLREQAEKERMEKEKAEETIPLPNSSQIIPPVTLSATSSSLMTGDAEMTSLTNESCTSISSTSSTESNVVKTNDEKPQLKQQQSVSNACVLCLVEEKHLACIPCGHLGKYFLSRTFIR